MSTVFKKKVTKKDTTKTIIDAIVKVATDKNHRVLLEVEEVEWQETKLREAARLGRILKKRFRGNP